MIIYLDTSSLVKIYVDEAGSSRVKELVDSSSVVSTSKVAYAEARAAFARKHKEGGLPRNALRKIVEDLNRDWENYFAIEVTDGLIRSSGDLAEKHLIRGFDSIHLASAVNLKVKLGKEVYFSSKDSKLNKAAEKEGFVVLV